MGIGDAVRKTLWLPIRALLPKNPWLRLLLFALPFVLLLALFGPALEVVLKLIDLFGKLIAPLLETTVGRILLLLVVFSLGGLFAVWLLKNRVRDMRAEAVLGLHLQAVADLVGLDLRKSRERLRKVSRYRGPVPLRYPYVVADANLKLARQSLDQGRTDEALGWLARVVPTALPPELLRSLLQLRVCALRRQGEVLPGALRAETQAAVDRFPNDYRLRCELRDLIAADGDPHALATAQAEVCKHAPPAALPREQQRLVDELTASGRAHLEAGERDACRRIVRKLASVDRDGPSSGLLLGDLHRSEGDLRQAIRAYGGTRSPAGLDRIAELLGEHPGVVDERELLEACPMQGALLLVARELARRGESARAERAARRAAEALGPTPTVCAVLAEVLELLGKEENARLLREQAVVRLLQPPPGGAVGTGAGGGT